MTYIKVAVHCARIDEETAEKPITRIIQKLGYSQLKPEQLKVIMEFVCGKDVFAVLPTGFGKTLCYACLPLVFDELTHRRAPSIILVVTPLNAIILYLTPCVMTREILINSVFNYIPAAQVQFTDVTRPFYSERRQVIKKSERRKRVGNARLA